MESITTNDLIERIGAGSSLPKSKPQIAFRKSHEDRTVITLAASINSIDVRLKNAIPISALRLEVDFKNEIPYKPISFGPRIQGFNSYLTFQKNSITLTVLDEDGRGIQPGTGTIVLIPIEKGQDFRVRTAYGMTCTMGMTEIESVVIKEDGPQQLELDQNNPDPFTLQTKIQFRIDHDADVKLLIYDSAGALVRTLMDSRVTSGSHSIEWDGKDDNGSALQSGIYDYRLYAGTYDLTKKMIYVR